MNYSRQNTFNRQNSVASQPTFKAAQSNAMYDRVIKAIAAKNSEIIEGFAPNKVKEVMSEFMRRYECMGVRSCGLQIVDNESLPKILGKDVAKYDLSDKIGVSVVVGNKFGPVEQMTNIYDAKTFILKASELNI